MHIIPKVSNLTFDRSHVQIFLELINANMSRGLAPTVFAFTKSSHLAMGSKSTVFDFHTDYSSECLRTILDRKQNLILIREMI